MASTVSLVSHRQWGSLFKIRRASKLAEDSLEVNANRLRLLQSTHLMLDSRTQFEEARIQSILTMKHQHQLSEASREKNRSAELVTAQERQAHTQEARRKRAEIVRSRKQELLRHKQLEAEHTRSVKETLKQLAANRGQQEQLARQRVRLVKGRGLRSRQQFVEQLIQRVRRECQTEKQQLAQLLDERGQQLVRLRVSQSSEARVVKERRKLMEDLHQTANNLLLMPRRQVAAMVLQSGD